MKQTNKELLEEIKKLTKENFQLRDIILRKQNRIKLIFAIADEKFLL